jgi:hypothetical protein
MTILFYFIFNSENLFHYLRENVFQLQNYIALHAQTSGHEVSPINDLFLPHDCIRPVVSLTVVQVFVFDGSIVKELFWVSNVFHPAEII